jgi:hypothetical protein
MQEQEECTTAAEAAAGEAFLEAVAAGDVLRVRQLLREHPPHHHHTINAVDHLGWCPPPVPFIYFYLVISNKYPKYIRVSQ